MADQTRIAPFDAAEVEQLARSARRGDPTGTPPVEPTDDAVEIGRRVVAALDRAHHDQQADDASRSAAYVNLRSLAVTGASAVARRVIKQAAPFKIRRNGALTTISSVFSVPSHLVDDGPDPDDDRDDDAEGEAVSWSARQYVQLDFTSWELLEWLRTHLARRRDGLGVTVTLLDDILKLKDAYPGCSPREAMEKAGLDPTTLQIDLDAALASLEADPDLGVHDGTG